MTRKSHEVRAAQASIVDRQTRVAWLFPSLARGFYWQPVFKEFATRFPQTRIFTGAWPGFARGYEGAFQVEVLRGVRFVPVKQRPNGGKGGYVRTPFSSLRQLIAFKPDVVFAAGFSFLTMFALVVKLFRRTRVIVFWEGCAPNSVGTSMLRRLTRRAIGRFVDAAVTNAHEGLEYLRDVVGIREDKILCHPCEVPDLSLLLAGTQASLPAVGRPIFLYVGSLIPRKGWRHLIEAAMLLRDKGTTSFSVIVVGTGEQTDELRTIIREQRLEHLVHLAGAVPYDELGSFFQHADVFVSPTQEDTWGVAVLEAMAFGKPVLCSKYAGARQMLAHGENGFIFDPYNTAQLACYMEEFIRKPELAEEFGTRSRELMVPYTPNAAAEALATILLRNDSANSYGREAALQRS